MTETKANAKRPTKKKAAPKKAAVKKAATPAIETLPDDDGEIIYDPQADENLDDETVAEDNRKRDIRAEMESNQGEIETLDHRADALRQRNQELLLELFPQAGKSDPLTVAVRGYIKSAKQDRANRLADPVRLARLLEQMQKAPIDAAMARRRGRGTARPVRPQKGIKSEA